MKLPAVPVKPASALSHAFSQVEHASTVVIGLDFLASHFTSVIVIAVAVVVVLVHILTREV